MDCIGFRNLSCCCYLAPAHSCALLRVQPSVHNVASIISSCRVLTVTQPSKAIRPVPAMLFKITLFCKAKSGCSRRCVNPAAPCTLTLTPPLPLTLILTLALTLT